MNIFLNLTSRLGLTHLHVIVQLYKHFITYTHIFFSFFLPHGKLYLTVHGTSGLHIEQTQIVYRILYIFNNGFSEHKYATTTEVE